MPKRLSSRIVTWQDFPKLYCSFMTEPCAAWCPIVFVLLYLFRDAKVSMAGVAGRAGRKWRAADVVLKAETWLKNIDSRSQAEVDAGGGASFSRGRANRESSGLPAALCLLEVGPGVRVGVIWKNIWHWKSQRIKFLILHVSKAHSTCAHEPREKHQHTPCVPKQGDAGTSNRGPKNCFSGLFPIARDWVMSNQSLIKTL